jgi:hypothetical protein
MTRPTYAPTITLGNLITIGSLAVTIIGFIVTTKADVDNVMVWSKEKDKEIRVNSNRLSSLEEWRSLGPRFTATDAELLKSRVLAEATIFTNQAVAKTEHQITSLGLKLDDVNKTLIEIRLILAANNLPKPE